MLDTTQIQDTLSIDDEAMDNVHYPDCHLLVLLGDKTLSYAIFNTATNQFIALHRLPAATDAVRLKVIENTAVFSQRFGAVKLGLIEKAFTFVPITLFLPDSTSAYLNSNEGSEQLIVNDHFVSALDVHSIFSYSALVMESVKNYFLNLNCYPLSAVLLQQIVKENRGQRKDLLHLTITEHYLYLFGFKNGDFVFGNRFHFDTETELLYFLLAVNEHYGFSTDNTGIKLAGDVTLYQPAISRFFKHVEPVAKPQAYRYSALMEALPSGSHYELFSLKGCE
ncbi:MAG: DUF3822 family protein [Chitinophagales bacterium]|nr:DUF3822 family protein [Chitinophagales bacterium]